LTKLNILESSIFELASFVELTNLFVIFFAGLAPVPGFAARSRSRETTMRGGIVIFVVTC
jgi:hypothetical protein